MTIHELTKSEHYHNDEARMTNGRRNYEVKNKQES